MVQDLLDQLDQSPRDYGYLRPTWTRELLILVSEDQAGVRVGLSAMSGVLRKIGARRGRPKPAVACPPCRVESPQWPGSSPNSPWRIARLLPWRFESGSSASEKPPGVGRHACLQTTASSQGRSGRRHASLENVLHPSGYDQTIFASRARFLAPEPFAAAIPTHTENWTRSRTRKSTVSPKTPLPGPTTA